LKTSKVSFWAKNSCRISDVHDFVAVNHIPHQSR